MDDLSSITFRKLRKNKSDEDTKTLRRKLLHHKHQEEHTGQSSPLPTSLPSSPPSHHVPFHNRNLGDWCRSKKLEEILTIFPPDMSLHEFSHLSPQLRQVSLGSPGRLVSPHHTGDMVIPTRPGQVVVIDARLKEKVMVAINAARAARTQAGYEVGSTPGGTPMTLSPNRRSLDVDTLSILHQSRFGSSGNRLSRELCVTTLSTRSLNTMTVSGTFSRYYFTGSAGNLQSGIILLHI